MNYTNKEIIKTGTIYNINIIYCITIFRNHGQIWVHICLQALFVYANVYLNPQPRVTSPTLYPLGHDCPLFCCHLFCCVILNIASTLYQSPLIEKHEWFRAAEGSTAKCNYTPSIVSKRCFKILDFFVLNVLIFQPKKFWVWKPNCLWHPSFRIWD